jgi:hypothetical protein
VRLFGVLGLLGLLFAMWRQRRKGRAEGSAATQTRIEEEVRNDVQKRVESGRREVERGRRSGADPAQRLRDNDGRWR